MVFDSHAGEPHNEPNTAFLSLILMLGTFIIAFGLKLFRNCHYLGRTARRALGDFGVPIAIVLMTVLDILIPHVYTQKLNVPSGLSVTAPGRRGWVIEPLGEEGDFPVWAMFAAVIPALLLYLLLFMETHICELILMEKSSKKGGGLHLDIVILSMVNSLVGVFGGPWMCAATVRSVAHICALSVMSTNHAPGESAKIVDVHDQRLSGLFVAIMVGLSVLLAPVLQLIPYSVLFGIFVYMGFSTIFGGIQFFDRIWLFFMPVKYHPQVSYVRRVKTWKLHFFTATQIVGLAILFTVMSIPQVALFFPFFIVAMIPLRLSLKFMYTPRELDAVSSCMSSPLIFHLILYSFHFSWMDPTLDPCSRMMSLTFMSKLIVKEKREKDCILAIEETNSQEKMRNLGDGASTLCKHIK